MDCRDGNEYCSVINSVGDDPADRSLDVAMVMHVRVVQGHLPATPEACRRIGFALDEDVDDLAIEIIGVGALWEVETGGPVAAIVELG